MNSEDNTKWGHLNKIKDTDFILNHKHAIVTCHVQVLIILFVQGSVVGPERWQNKVMEEMEHCWVHTERAYVKQYLRFHNWLENFLAT